MRDLNAKVGNKPEDQIVMILKKSNDKEDKLIR